MSFSSLTLDPPTPAQRPLLSKRSPPAQIQARAQTPLPSEPTVVDRLLRTRTESTPSSSRAFRCKREDPDAEILSSFCSPSPQPVSRDCSVSDQEDGLEPALGQVS